MSRYIDADKIRYKEKENIDGYVYSEVVSRNKIDSMPIEDVKPVIHAEWMPCLNKCLEATHYVCSKCKGSSFKRNKTKYCHNCGAKMEE